MFFLQLRKQAQRLCNCFGIRSRSNEKPGAHLPFDSPSLEAVRSHIKKLCEDGLIEPRLVCNFDQVWSMRFRPHKRSLQKPPDQKHMARDPLARSMLLRRVRHNLERSLDLPLTKADPQVKQVKSQMAKPMVTEGSAASAMVQDWRLPRTVTTLSFMDGWMGRSFITVRDGQLPESTRRRLNDELSRFVAIDTPQPRSHIWNEATFVRYLEHLAQELGHPKTYPPGHVCSNSCYFFR